METMHKILKRFAESEKRQELSTHKIELNIINNAKGALESIEKAKKDSFKNLEKARKNGQKYASQINKIVSNYLEELNEVSGILLKESQIQDGQASIKRIEDTAKDLGLKAKEIPVYNKLKKELVDAEDLINDLKQFDSRQYNDFKRLINI